jgi:hypothetical protein
MMFSKDWSSGLSTALALTAPPLLKMIAWPPYLDNKLFIKGGVKHRLAQ